MHQTMLQKMTKCQLQKAKYFSSAKDVQTAAPKDVLTIATEDEPVSPPTSRNPNSKRVTSLLNSAEKVNGVLMDSI